MIDGHASGVGEDLAFLTNVVAPEYFRTLTIGLVAGREFESRDDAAAPPVAIVNETLARRFWSDPSAAIGQRLRVGTDGWRTVIGVARDVKYSRVTEGPRPYVYLPLLQTYQSSMVLHVRGSAGTATTIDRVRAHLQALDPDLPLLEARTLGELTRGKLRVSGGDRGRALRLWRRRDGAGGDGPLRPRVLHGPAEHAGDRGANGARRPGRPSHLALPAERVVARRDSASAIGGLAALASARLLGSVLYGVDSTDPAVVRRGARRRRRRRRRSPHSVPAWRAARSTPGDCRACSGADLARQRSEERLDAIKRFYAATCRGPCR